MGKLFVIEGIDGSGKSTQLGLLQERLLREGARFMAVSFPRYSRQSSALVKMYLSGEFGTRPNDVNAYAASGFFAVDRFASYKSEEWGRFYDDGGVVLTDRYTTSNAVHQGAKLTETERAEFFGWLYDFEFRLLGLPKPDTVIYMDIDIESALHRISGRDGDDDIHEKDAGYMKVCAECSRQAAELLGWTRVNARQDEKDIHEQIFALIKKEIQ